MKDFINLFTKGKKILRAKFNVDVDEGALDVEIANTLGKKGNSKDFDTLAQISSNPVLQEFIVFYKEFDGFDLALPLDKKASRTPLLKQLPFNSLTKFTRQYLPAGKLAWVIDSNKSWEIYRTSDEWLAFAEVDGGPACLTIFTTGANAGKIFLLCPQPHFNNRKPVAQSYNKLLERITNDPIAFFKPIKGYVRVMGTDKQYYGYVPIEYITSE